jgi:ketosteroid isomerase-like protein
MRNAVTVAALALMVVVSACAGKTEQQFTRADADAIRKNTAEFIAAFNAKQVDKVVEFYGENSVLMPPNKPMLRGRDILKSYYGEQMSRGALSMEIDEIQGHGPLAYEFGTYAMAFSDGNRDRGKYLRVLRLMNGAWRTEKTIWSSDLPTQTHASAD